MERLLSEGMLVAPGEAMVQEAGCALLPGSSGLGGSLVVARLKGWYTGRCSVGNCGALWALICLVAWESLGLTWWLRY